jgi:hypothetical protein
MEDSERKKDRKKISCLTPAAEAPCAQGGYVCGKADTQQINIVKYTRAMPETQNVAGLRAVGKQRIDGMFYSAIAEITQERIARTQRQKSQPWLLTRESFRVKAIDNFVRSTVTTHRDEIPHATAVGIE